MDKRLAQTWYTNAAIWPVNARDTKCGYQEVEVPPARGFPPVGR